MASASQRPSPPGKKSGARALNGKCREIVFNVYNYMKTQKEQHGIDINLAESTSDATGVSRSTVVRIIREGKRTLDPKTARPSFSTPRISHGGQNKKDFGEFGESLIRRKVQEFYLIKQECPTVNKLLRELREEGVIDCGKTVLRNKIHEIGFMWKTYSSNRKLLIEKPYITLWRERYLEQIKLHRENNRPIVYLDETYLHATHVTSKCWQSEEEIGATKAISKGKRLIILHAGGNMGFINNALLIFKSDTTTGDYHGAMNSSNFMKWLEEQLIPNLPQNSVVVMDNAAYHCVEKNKKPNTLTLKSRMQEWLTEKRITFCPTMTKARLLDIIKKVPMDKEYILDEILKKHGHSILRLPPYHPDLNPIELVWSYIKGKVRKECLSSKLDIKKRFAEKCFSEYTREMWEKCCEYVINAEITYYENDKNLDKEMDEIIVKIGEIDASSFSSEDDDDEYFSYEKEN